MVSGWKSIIHHSERSVFGIAEHAPKQHFGNQQMICFDPKPSKMITHRVT